MRRWTLRIIFGLLALLLIIAVTVQVVLWTDLPKRLVVGQIEKQLGLRVSAEALSTGWLGNTSLRDVTLSLPLADESFLDVPKMRVSHTSLPMLLIRRAVTIDSIEMDRPTLALRRDEAGRWNIADVAELIARAGGKKNTQPTTGAPKLPDVRVANGIVNVRDYGGQTANIEPLNLVGESHGPLVYRYDVKLADKVSLVGEVAPGGKWAHQVEATLKELAPWLEPWVEHLPENASASISWRGSLDRTGQVQGRLQIEQAQFGTYGASGAMAVRSVGGGVVVEPAGLTLTSDQKILPEVQLVSGRITADMKAVKAERLRVSGVGGQALAEGNYLFRANTGDIKAEWSNLAFPELALTGVSGSLSGSLEMPSPGGRPKVSATLVTQGKLPDGAWNATLVAKGRGITGFSEMDWTVTGENLDWLGNYPAELDGLIAHLETRRHAETGSTVVRLLGVERPGSPAAEAQGQYDVASQEWNLAFNSGGIGMPKTAAEMNLVVSAWGNEDEVRLEHFEARGAELEIDATGSYVYKKPKPVDLDVDIRHFPPARDPDQPPVHGFLQASLKLTGTAAAPRHLEVTGKMRARDLQIGERRIDEITGSLGGTINNSKAHLFTKKLDLFDGQWDIDVVYSAKTRGVTIGMEVVDLALEEVGRFMQFDDLAGKLNGEWTINVPRLELPLIEMDGRIEATGLKATELEADQLTATMKLAQGRLTIDPIRLSRSVTRNAENVAQLEEDDPERSTVNGAASATVSLDLARPKQLAVSLSAGSWPIKLAGVWFDISGGTPEMNINLDAEVEKEAEDRLAFIPANWAVSGNLQLTASMSARGTSIGDASINASLHGREADIRSVRITTFGGSVEGNALIDADYPLDSTASFAWTEVDSRLLADLFPGAVGLDGTYDGSFRVEPANEPRALEPLAFDIALDPKDGRYRDLQIGPARFHGYTNLKRVVLADLSDKPSTWQLAGGVATIWGRFSSHETSNTRNVLSTQGTLLLEGMSLDQIVRTGAPDADPMPGIVDGSFTLVGSTNPRRQQATVEIEPAPAFLELLTRSVTAEGSVQLSQSNLANIDAFAMLYNLMNLGQNVRTPTGAGTVQVRMEDGSLYLNNLRYFNRGTEIRAMATIDQIWRLPESPIRGSAVGNARPLASIKLPLFSDLDKILTIIQPTSVRIVGTVKDPKPIPLGFNEINEAMRAFVIDDVKAATGKK